MTNKTAYPKAWLFVLPVVVLVAFNAVIPLMTVVNYSVQETSTTPAATRSWTCATASI